MESIELEPLFATRPQWPQMASCPFCSAKANEFHISVTYCTDRDGNLKTFMGECDECAAMGPHGDTPEDALRLWNSRSPTQ